NGWHFAAQHAGILRIYARKSPGGSPWLERHGLRLFLCYVIARTAGWTTGWLEDAPAALRGVAAVDAGALLLPLTLVALELAARPLRTATLAYLAGVCGLYSALLLALAADAKALVLALTTATAVFHATEYLALVTYYARRRAASGSPGWFQRLARAWPGCLAL